MCEIVCVTQSILCGDNFLNQIEKICIGGIDRIILREKHLSENEYFRLAYDVKKICGRYNISLTIHNFSDTAIKLDVNSFHCSGLVFAENKYKFQHIGVSVHSVEEALNAEKSGASCITAGHVFETQCKAGFAPRGVDFIKNVCRSVKIPVYAIGGINPGNINLLRDSGIKGVCIMSGFMKAENPKKYIKSLRANL